MSSLRLAFGFLTIIPIRVSVPVPGALGRAARWFPLVGLMVGGLLAIAAALLIGRLTSLLAATLIVTLWAILTGGLHLDGLADCCDGLLPPGLGTAERRLDIMRDPRLGTFGGIGLCLFLILKILAMAEIVDQGLGVRGYPFANCELRIANCEFPITTFVLLLSPTLARWLILPVATQPSARPGGRGADFALGLNRTVFILAGLLPLAVVILGGMPALVAALLAHGVALAIVGLARVRLGGVTGDVLGFTVEAAELTILLTYAVM
jgi:adenosylcobinamide-GDP ribazoletransferase